jgi:chromosomal replication initiator protein
VLDELHPRPRPTAASIEDIQKAVADRYGVSVAELKSPSRAARLSWPRQLAIHLVRELTGASLQAIGEAFGGRNHATVIHACKRVEDRVNNDQQASSDLEELAATLSGSS